METVPQKQLWGTWTWRWRWSRPEDAETTSAATEGTVMTMVTTTATASSSTHMVTAEVYAQNHTQKRLNPGECEVRQGVKRRKLRKERKCYKNKRMRKTVW